MAKQKIATEADYVVIGGIVYVPFCLLEARLMPGYTVGMEYRHKVLMLIDGEVVWRLP